MCLLLCMRDNDCSGNPGDYLGHFKDGDRNYRNEKFMAFLLNEAQGNHVDALIVDYDISINFELLDESTGMNGFATDPYREEALSLEHLSVEVFDAHIIKTPKPLPTPPEEGE